jgi:hypothetical protein
MNDEQREQRSDAAPAASSRRRSVARGAMGATIAAVLLWPGTAPGTIAEQRARLPPAAFCSDPVEGVWQSHDFHAGYQEWALFTLEIRRDPENPEHLTGRLINRSWDGGSDRSEPYACEGQLDYEVSMEGAGSYRNGLIDFYGINWNLDRIYCGTSRGFAYNLDRFSGQIDPDLMEFQSLNNDGGRYVNVPTVFRRVRCLDDLPPSAALDLPPPPLFAERSRWGCGG